MRQGPVFPRLWTFTTLVALWLAASAMTAASAQAHAPIGFALAKAFGFVAGNAKLIDVQANRAYRRAERIGSCSARRAEFAAILPDALRLSGYARAIYDHEHGGDAEASAAAPLQAAKDLGNGWTAYFEANGKRYAEVLDDDARREIVIVFRGTRLNVTSDLSADVLSMTGIETTYFKWAASLVGKIALQHPDRQIVVTGHSLGGGLVIYSVLHNKGVRGVAFNPTGVSWLRWLATSRAERTRTSAALTIVSTRNARHIEPVTAIALAGRTVLPGHIYFAEADETRALTLHSAATVTATLQQLAGRPSDELPCEDVIGPVAR